MKTEKNYTIGNAKVAITSGRIIGLEIPFISFEDIESDTCKVGQDLLGKNEPTINKTKIFFKNLEELAVLEKAIKIVKKNLKDQQKKI